MEDNIDKLIAQLGVNYKNNKEVLQDILDTYTSIASNISNRETTDSNLIPYINIATIKAYIRQGEEGIKNSSTGAISYTYDDIIATLRTDIINNGLRRIK